MFFKTEIVIIRKRSKIDYFESREYLGFTKKEM